MCEGLSECIQYVCVCVVLGGCGSNRRLITKVDSINYSTGDLYQYLYVYTCVTSVQFLIYKRIVVNHFKVLYIKNSS